jgi:hypothetical protein
MFTIGDVAHCRDARQYILPLRWVILYMKGDGNSNSKFVADSTNTTNSVLRWTLPERTGFCVAHADEPFIHRTMSVCGPSIQRRCPLTVLYFTPNKPGMSARQSVIGAGTPAYLVTVLDTVMYSL